MHRHPVRFLSFVWGIVFGASLLTGPLLAAEETRPPNVVFILCDDLGYGELGCFGQTKIRTPNIDRLAAAGMKLTRHYSGNAVCAPSRCVLLTGKHPGHAFIRNNGEMQPEGQRPIPDEEVTLAELFKSAGYATGAFGKWGLGGPGSEGDPNRQGFDRFYGYNCQRHAHSFYPGYLWSDQERVALDNDPPVKGHAGLAKGADPNDSASYDAFKGKDYASDRINAEALTFIDANKDKPFFLYYPTLIPHLALHVPDEYLIPYHKLRWDDPPFTRAIGYGYTPHFTPKAAYAAMITRMDTYVGKIMRRLKKHGLTENTIVVFSSDNGATHLKHEVDVEFFNSVGDLRGLKGSLYEGGIRVPTIVTWPGTVPAGFETSVVSGFEDWMTTLVSMSGIEATLRADHDGIDLSKALKGQGEGDPERPFLYREFSGYGGQQAVWEGDWKAVRQQLRRGKVVTELYHLGEDPSEATDVAAAYPEVVARLEKRLADEHVKSEHFPLPAIDFEVKPKPKKKANKQQAK